MAKLKAQLDPEGSVSLQNALTLCMDALKSVPPYGHREVHTGHGAVPMPVSYVQA